jgi:ATP-dependent Clp protease ATP-binding subunit ClpA
LERRFQKVAVRELGVPETLDILRARKERLERHHNVVIADEAIAAAVELTDKFVTDRRRPDKAIDALDEACAHTQAVSKYPPRAETLMKDRVRRLREATVAHRKLTDAGNHGQREHPDDGEGMSALERFGAELESMFSGGPPTPPPPPPPRPEPVVVEPVATFGELETELSRVLADEGIVVRGHDVARVVGLMSGRQVAWEPA